MVSMPVPFPPPLAVGAASPVGGIVQEDLGKVHRDVVREDLFGEIGLTSPKVPDA